MSGLRHLMLLIGNCSYRFTFFLLFIHFSIYSSLLQAATPPPGEIERAVQAGSEDPGLVDDRLEQLIHQDTNTSLEVPPVYERPVGIDAGVRLHVKKFIVEGVNERPELGLTQEAIDALVEKLRIEFQSITKMNEFGLTEEDMAAAGKELRDALYSKDENVLQKYEQLLEKLRKEKKYREEMSIGQLQEVANRITDFYRQKGFVVAQAYIPEQTVEEGVVKIAIQEGILGNVIVTDNQDYSSEIIRKRFDHLAFKTINKELLEDALLSLGDYPGLIAYGVLQAGDRPGETHLIIKVQEEEPRNYTIKADNYGSELTGENRLTLTYVENNIFGNADDLTIYAMKSFSPTNTVFGGIKYTSPIAGSDFMLGAGYSTNTFDVGGELAAIGVNGAVASADVFASYQFIRSRNANLFSKLNFTNKVAETKIQDTLFKEDAITSVALEMGFDVLDTRYKGINQGKFKFTQGLEGVMGSLDQNDISLSSRSGGSGEVATSDFSKFEWSVARLQLISKYQNVLLRFNGQLSDDLLVPVEQYGMGGPNNVRAFTVSEYLRDSAYFVSVDWNFNAPGFYDSHAFGSWKWGEVLQMGIFADYATGEVNDPLVSDIESVDLAGYGIALQLLLPGKLQIRLDVAKPAKDPLDKDEIQYYFTMSYTG